MSFRNVVRRTFMVCVLTCSLLPRISAAADEYRQDFLVFAKLVSLDSSGMAGGDESDLNPALTVMYVGHSNRFRALVEVAVNEDYQRVERLQLGLKFSDTHTVWLGRSHTPAGYWNTEFHHGTYLQNSISRPGPTLTIWPRHITGLTLAGTFAATDHKLSYSVSGGDGFDHQQRNDRRFRFV